MATKADLFTDPLLPHEERPGEHAQVSPIAEYVLTVLPDDLAAIRAATPDVGELTAKYGEATEVQVEILEAIAPLYNELSAKHTAILEKLEDEIAINEDPHTALVTQLDLAFMLSSYLPLGSTAFDVAPEKLQALLASQAERFGLPDRMDYELIIDVNSQEYFRTGQIRTFLSGEDAYGERDFYQGHALSEEHIKAVATQLQSILDDPSGDHVDDAFIGAARDMREFRDYMARYIKLSAPIFSTLRSYLAQYPDGRRNASGAFMPSVQLAELTFQAPTAAQLDYIDEALPSFPRWARPLIQKARQASLYGSNIQALFDSGDIKASTEGRAAYQKVLDEFLRSKTTHKAAVNNQIPTAFAKKPDLGNPHIIADFGEPSIFEEGDEQGTAGFDIYRLLGGVIFRTGRISETFRKYNSAESEKVLDHSDNN